MWSEFLSAAARSKALCIRSQVSGVLPKALNSRIAISGEIPDFSLTMLLSAWRETPKSLAAFVTERSRGSRQSNLTMRPGCTGFFIGMAFSC